jgi:hypothetical protein
MLETHINLLKLVSTVHVLGKRPDPHAGSIPGSGRVPWINTTIIISDRHALKAKVGIVKDVFCNQSTASGLKVEVELMTFDAMMSLRHLILDYDGVVEARYLFPAKSNNALTYQTTARVLNYRTTRQLLTNFSYLVTGNSEITNPLRPFIDLALSSPNP